MDYGTVRIGLAISDPGQTLASPLEIYQPRNERLDLQYFRQLCEREQVAGFVVGLPLHTSGESSSMSEAAIRFGRWLGQATGRPVTWFDERYTSSEAEEIFREVKRTKLQKRRLLDKLAARIILAGFLESDRRPPPGIPPDPD